MDLDLGDTVSAAWDSWAGEGETETGEAKGVFGRDIEPRAACSGGEGIGMSRIPTSNNR